MLIGNVIEFGPLDCVHFNEVWRLVITRFCPIHLMVTLAMLKFIVCCTADFVL